MDFGRILGRFLEGFDLTMIRATKGISMDGWMDGWMMMMMMMITIIIVIMRRHDCGGDGGDTLVMVAACAHPWNAARESIENNNCTSLPNRASPRP